MSLAGSVATWQWKLHEVTDDVPADTRVARAVAIARHPFLAGGKFDRELANSINEARLAGPIDQVVGYTTVALHRSTPADHGVPPAAGG